jgi:hypothetical protein
MYISFNVWFIIFPVAGTRMTFNHHLRWRCAIIIQNDKFWWANLMMCVFLSSITTNEKKTSSIFIGVNFALKLRWVYHHLLIYPRPYSENPIQVIISRPPIDQLHYQMLCEKIQLIDIRLRSWPPPKQVLSR